MAKLTINVEMLSKIVSQRDQVTFTAGFIQGTNRWVGLTQTKEGDINLYVIHEVNKDTPWNTLKPTLLPVEEVKRHLIDNTFEKYMFLKVLPELNGFDVAFQPTFFQMANNVNEKLEGFSDFNVNYVLFEKNQEVKSRLLRKFGYERFLLEGKMEKLHTDGKENLYKSGGDIVLLQFFDPAKNEIGFIRVPPNVKTVKEAAAWTFNMNEKDYVANLKQET